jgi:proline dehydrogenase
MLRSILLKLSESKSFAHWVTSNATTRRMSRRFVAGETLEEALQAARACNDAGMLATLDYLGENVSTTADAQKARDTYLEIFDRIAQEKLNGNVSCKLTQLGLDFSVDFCEGLVLSIAERAAAYDSFLRIDMEGSIYTQRTVELVKQVRAQTPAVGTVIQSYLYRSEPDIQDLLGYGCRIRLCKGAYKEPADVAFPSKAEVDANFVRLMRILLPSGFYHGIATHDPRMKPSAGPRRSAFPRTISNFRCSMACAPICNAGWSATAIACVFTFLMGRTGFPTSCAGSRNVLPT